MKKANGAEEWNGAGQPPFPAMSNNDQRRAFLDSYTDWPVWFEVPQADEVYYRYDLPDGSSIVICRYRYWADWMEKYMEMCKHANLEMCKDDNPDAAGTREYLLKPGFHYLHDCWSNRTTLVEHLRRLQRGAKSYGKEG